MDRQAGVERDGWMYCQPDERSLQSIGRGRWREGKFVVDGMDRRKEDRRIHLDWRMNGQAERWMGRRHRQTDGCRLKKKMMVQYL